MNQGKQQAIGILGGTFDPIHFGHLRSAWEIKSVLGLTTLRLIPSHTPPHRKQPEASAQCRLAMLKLAITGIDGLVVDEREIARQGVSYTVDTLQSLVGELINTPICLIIGMDAFAQISTWKRWEELLTLAHIVIATRPNEQIALDSAAQSLLRQATTDVTSLHKKNAGLIYQHDVTTLAISASAIRAQCHAKQMPYFLVPAPVLSYIQSHKLYQ